MVRRILLSNGGECTRCRRASNGCLPIIARRHYCGYPDVGLACPQLSAVVVLGHHAILRLDVFLHGLHPGPLPHRCLCRSADRHRILCGVYVDFFPYSFAKTKPTSKGRSAVVTLVFDSFAFHFKSVIITDIVCKLTFFL